MVILIVTLLFSLTAFSQDSRHEARKLITLATHSVSPAITDISLIQMGKAIQKFLQDPKNKSITKSIEGKALTQIQLKLANYLAVKKKLEACVKEKDSRLQLSERIAGAILLDKESCADSLSSVSIDQLKDFNAVLASIEKTYKPKDTNDWDKLIDFRDDALEKGFNDALKTHIDLKYRNSPAGTKIDVERDFNQIFEMSGVGVPGSNAPSRFDSGVKDDVIEKGKRYLKELQKTVKPQTSEQTRIAFNKRIVQMRNAIATIPRVTKTMAELGSPESYDLDAYNKYKDKGGAKAWARDAMANHYDEVSRRNKAITNYNVWAADHLKETLELPSGNLMFTKSVAEYFVPPVKINDQTPFKIKEIPNDKVISDGVKEALNETKKYGQYLAKMNFHRTGFTGVQIDKKSLKEQITSLTRSAPATIAESLVKNPSAIGMVCEAINTANEDQKSDERKEEIYMYGGLVVGGALLVTGVGSAVGASVLAGTATGTILTTVAAGSAILGTTASIAEIGYLSYRANKLNGQNQELTAALFSSANNDPNGWAEAKKLSQELEDTNFSLSLAAGFMVLDVGTLGLSLKGLSNIEKMDKLSGMEKLLKEISKDPVAVARLKKLSTTMSEKEISQLIYDMADQEMGMAQVRKILDKPDATHLPMANRQIAQVSPSRISQELSTQRRLSPSQMSYSKLKPLSARSVDPVELDLQKATFKKVEIIGDGQSTNQQTRLVTLDNNQKAVWKPHTETWGSNYRAEVLAYEIDKKLGFNLVPVTVEKEVNGVKGSLQLFKKSAPIQASVDDLNKQQLLDFILNNRDRGSNFLVGQNGKVVSFDNGMSFTNHGTNYTGAFKDARPAIKQVLLKPEGRAIIEKIKNLDMKQFRKEVKAYLGEQDGEFLARRIEILRNYEKEIIR